VRAAGPWLDLRILLSTGLKMFGVSFPVLRKVFLMPTSEVVEDSYRSRIAGRAVLSPMQQPA
jgi:hypothetical protein